MSLNDYQMLSEPEAKNEVEKKIFWVCRMLASMLIHKNRAYGNSALSPLRIFSKASPTEQINVRMDDKLSRIARGSSGNEDPKMDLAGYLILDMVLSQLDSEVLKAEPSVLDKCIREAVNKVKEKTGELGDANWERISLVITEELNHQLTDKAQDKDGLGSGYCACGHSVFNHSSLCGCTNEFCECFKFRPVPEPDKSNVQPAPPRFGLVPCTCGHGLTEHTRVLFSSPGLPGTDSLRIETTTGCNRCGCTRYTARDTGEKV